MKISFDLDDLLIPSSKDDFATEQRAWFQKVLGVEHLRLYAKEIFHELRSSGNEVGIYTTSYRSVAKIKLLFRSYGIKVDFIINEKINRKRLNENSLSCSKHPPTFGIDFHIDDSEGVGIEGKCHNFKVLVIPVNHKNWINEIRANLFL